MLINLLDASGVSQKVAILSQEAVVDHSGTITATGVAQVLLSANALRSGWVMENRGSNVMHVNELGTATSGSGSFSIQPSSTFPPYGFPLTTGAVSIIGTIGDKFTVREW